jgi:hypothetical protein
MADSKPRVRHLQEVRAGQYEDVRRDLEDAADRLLNENLRGFVLVAVLDRGAVRVHHNTDGGAGAIAMLGALNLASVQVADDINDGS